MATARYEQLDPEDDNEDLGNGASSSDRRSLIDDIQDSRIPRPPVYYGEGPFEAPSSDDEDETFIEKLPPRSPGGAERALYGSGSEPDLVVGGKKRPASLRYLIISLGTLLFLAISIGIYAARSYTGTSMLTRGAKHITLEHIFNGTFNARQQSLRWVPEAGDGVFSIDEEGYIKLVDLKTNTSTNLVLKRDIKDNRGIPLSIVDWTLSANMDYMLVKTDYRKQWRWSTFGNYYVHDLLTGSTHALIPPAYPPTISYATWAPTGQSIAFVSENDLYLVPSASPSATPIRITYTGSSSIFNGVADWVYEEEVYSSPSTLWFSPSAEKIAFLTLDETLVDTYTFPIYNPTADANTVVPYTSSVFMKYPKPGYANPFVRVRVFDVGRYGDLLDIVGSTEQEAAEGATTELDWPARLPSQSSIVSEVAWVGNTTLVVKEVDRAAEEGSVVLFELFDSASGEAFGTAVRRLGKDGERRDGGWIESAQTIFPLPPSFSPTGLPAYLDIVPTPAGYNHIALFNPASSYTPRFLTTGEWEVSEGILAVDTKRNLVYFAAANPTSIERNIFSVPIPTTASEVAVEPSALVDVSISAYHKASFSPQAGFYLLNYLGPDVPSQRVLQVDNPGFEYVLTTNEELNKTLGLFQSPIISRTTINSEGYELNALEIRPPRMDDSGRTKYPVLFRVYGGPNSQLVDTKYSRDWHTYLACSLHYIVVVVDGRGTGFKGRTLRNPVNRNLGFWETRDQVNAARIWAAKQYVDSRRIGIWGWSYGGFMSAKVAEADAGIHSLAMSVAPVTSWRLYDSIYTERYMGLPDSNPGGYINASISNVTAFDKVDFLLAHGSGDDNVHYANTAHLLDMFTQAQIRKFRFRMFTDSDHSISTRGANRELYEFMTDFLLEKWGKGGRTRGW